MVRKENVVLVEHPEKIRSDGVETCPPSGASVTTIRNNYVADPAEPRAIMIHYGIQSGDRMELYQMHSNGLVRLGRQAVKRARQGCCRPRSYADDVFDGRLRLLWRSFNDHHAAAFAYPIDKMRKGAEHALESQTPPEQLIRPKCEAVCC